MSVVDFQAAQKWAKVPKHLQKRLLRNVLCSNCGETEIVDYTLHNDEYGVLLKGKCKQCGEEVARLVESPE